MSELAFNLNGDPFDVPTNAVGWRVRKMKNKGAPEVTYGRNGQPLVLPLEADVDDLRAEVGATGRYRLDPIDDTNKPIADSPAGYVFLHEVQETGARTLAPITLPPPSDNVVIEAMRMNSEIAKSVVDRFPQMLEAAATLLRAADGAGLPSRAPREIAREVDSDDEENDDIEDDRVETPSSSAGFDLINTLVAQLVPMLMTSMAGKKLPKLSAVLDWRKAQPKEAAVEAPTSADDPAHDYAAMDVATMARVIAIQSALTPAEAALARQLGAELSPSELRAWFAELSALSIPEAVEKIRSVLNTKSGGAS